MDQPRLTACLIVRDEEELLPACLASVAFCDEVVVVDSGSTDRTVEIARAAGARVLENPWPGFARQRNHALDHARGTWVLEVDADERISPELAREIRAFVEAPGEFDCAAFPIRHDLLGGPLGPSARYPDYRLRLVRRGVHRHDTGRYVHEGHWPRGPVRVLEGDMRHHLARTWSEAYEDLVGYARLERRHLAGQRVTPRGFLIGALVRPTLKLAYRLLLFSAWRDGWRGLVKLSLDSGSDTLVWALRVLDRGQAAPDAPVLKGHFSGEKPVLGPVRLVVVAPGRATAGALRWAQDARAAGADVTVVGEGEGTPELRVRRLEGRGPVALVRALDVEDQVRAVDAVVAAGPHARRLLRTVPGRLQGGAGVLDAGTDPAAVVARVRAATREGAA